MSEELKIQINQQDENVIVQFTGDATVTDIDKMRKALTPLQATEPSVKKVVLDLAELVFINSLGLGVLLELRQNLNQKNVELCMTAVSQRVKHVLDKTCLTGLFPTYETVDQAIA